MNAKINALETSYNETLQEFYKVTFVFWEEASNKIVEDFALFYPESITIYASRGMDVKEFKEKVKSLTTTCLEQLKRRVSPKPNHVPYFDIEYNNLPLSYTPLDLRQENYPKELREPLKEFIQSFLSDLEKLEDEYSLMKTDRPKLDRSELSKRVAIPQNCLEKLEQMHNNASEITKERLRKTRVEYENNLKKAKELWSEH